MNRRLLGSAALTVALAAALAGCSDDGDPQSSGDSDTPTATESASPYLPVPDGVTLTPQGTHLEVGDQGVVAWEPRQDEVGVLDLTVTEIERTTTRKTLSAWQLSKEQEASTPYFVHVTVENVGDTDLGGRRVPLYVVNEENLLLESTPFASSFTPCPSTPLPSKFGPGAHEDVCLVYLAPDHGTLEAVSFRPDESFDPIIWTGEIEKYVPPKPEKKKPKGKNKNNGG
ncbi:hypothetical protein [Nocardioides sp. YIM 152315]|uniref:hypothetical protein n=1 Tax=Nocardioides sp. YIM 152315 TaxID=3031760 RepID=UPI0023DC6F06|nr:hypothetical protein [Nocardioides sp. YIM 152315]MDF1603838.1 hypothetical protein [Nocardioides sp. YIM 152315]